MKLITCMTVFYLFPFASHAFQVRNPFADVRRILLVSKRTLTHEHTLTNEMQGGVGGGMSLCLRMYSIAHTRVHVHTHGRTRPYTHLHAHVRIRE